MKELINFINDFRAKKKGNIWDIYLHADLKHNKGIRLDCFFPVVIEASSKEEALEKSRSKLSVKEMPERMRSWLECLTEDGYFSVDAETGKILASDWIGEVDSLLSEDGDDSCESITLEIEDYQAVFTTEDLKTIMERIKTLAEGNGASVEEEILDGDTYGYMTIKEKDGHKTFLIIKLCRN